VSEWDEGLSGPLTRAPLSAISGISIRFDHPTDPLLHLHNSSNHVFGAACQVRALPVVLYKDSGKCSKLFSIYSFFIGDSNDI
jgi:hypothetical protein